MKIELLVVGKTRHGWIREGEDFYLQRLRRYTDYMVTVIPSEKGPDISQTISRESMRILGSIANGPRMYNILLVDDGKQYSSEAFAGRIDQIMAARGPAIRFLIGGAFGVSDEVRDMADECVSLSILTFPHELVRVIFLEQLYRAFTILRGESYHHG